MAEGITYGGEFVEAEEAGEDESLAVEVPTSDPNFIVRAASKNPPSAWERARQIIKGVGDGAYSWPFDYTLCVHWILGHAGFYGDRVQQTCFHHRDRVLSVLKAAGRVTYYLIFRGLLWKLLSNETAQNVARDQIGEDGRRRLNDALGKVMPSEQALAKMAGRYGSGQFFTRWMQSRIRQRGGGGLETGGIAVTNTLMLFWGSAIHSSMKHPNSFGVIEIFVAWINGDAEYSVSDELYKEVFSAAQDLATSPEFAESLGADFQLYREFVDSVTELGSNGGP